MAGLHSTEEKKREPGLLSFFVVHLFVIMPLVYCAMQATVSYGDAKIAHTAQQQHAEVER